MKYRILLFFILSATSMVAQTPLDWYDFEQGILWKKGDSDSTFPGFMEADFSDRLVGLEGKEVSIVGFLIVLDGAQAVYMLSKNPMASCFFCGNGGPETIAQVSFTQKTAFQMDDLVTVTGILKLNRNDSTSCYYHIDKAKAFGL